MDSHGIDTSVHYLKGAEEGSAYQHILSLYFFYQHILNWPRFSDSRTRKYILFVFSLSILLRNWTNLKYADTVLPSTRLGCLSMSCHLVLGIRRYPVPFFLTYALAYIVTFIALEIAPCEWHAHTVETGPLSTQNVRRLVNHRCILWRDLTQSLTHDKELIQTRPDIPALAVVGPINYKYSRFIMQEWYERCIGNSHQCAPIIVRHLAAHGRSQT